ncbi:MAG: glutaminyl-peptide cyclotransferase [Bacteroidetes bacterium]|nr:glutaminyl-peptide cyclotransferase [Bacteroidota bacterium]
MRKLNSLVSYSLLFSALLFGACTGDDKKSDDQSLPFLVSNESALQGVYGKEIPVKIQLNESLSELVALLGNDTLKFWKTPGGNLVLSFNTKESGIGKHDVKFIGKKSDGSFYDQIVTIEVLSDVPFTMLEAKVLTSYPHLETSFIQGLEFDGDQLYEGTGDPNSTGATLVAKVDLKTGNHTSKTAAPIPNFGEGITILNGKLYQLTWQQQTCFVYDKTTLKKEAEFKYEGEGWGLCNDGQYLIMSNGTSTLTFRDPKTFKIVKTIQVSTHTSSVSNLNELEYANGLIYANIWQDKILVSIEPSSGRVREIINCYSLVKMIPSISLDKVLNGIAHKKSSRTFYLTGKYWPTLFEVNFTPQRL